METRANHFLVGLFVLILLLAGGGFIIWAARLGFDAEPDRYRIYFTGSVTGLSVASPVRYSGVRVGEVARLRINPDLTQEIEVTVELDPDTPVKVDSIASLEVAGIAGGTYVQLSGGSLEAPLLQPLYDGQMPIIHARASTLARLLEDVPQILGKIEEAASSAADLIGNLNDQITGERLQRIDNILANVEQATGKFAEAGDDISGALKAVQDIAEDTKSLMSRVDTTLANLDTRSVKLLDNANGLIDDARQTVTSVDGKTEAIVTDWRKTTEDARQLMARISATSAQLQGFLGNNEEAVQEFATSGLAELTLLFAELRDLAANLNRVVSGIERDPGQVIFGTTRHGVEVE